MKKIFIATILLMFITSIANAESYLLIDKETKEVKSLSNEDDAQLQPGWEKIILPTEFRDIELMYAPCYYYYRDKRFVVNTAKLSDEALKQQEILEKAEEEVWVKEYLQDMAITELKKAGKEFRHLRKKEE